MGLLVLEANDDKPQVCNNGQGSLYPPAVVLIGLGRAKPERANN